jgi:hypothetical protein
MSLSESQTYTVTLSGRELALRRRQAMSSLGKSAIKGASQTSSTGSEHQRKSAQNVDRAGVQDWPFSPMPARASQDHEVCGPECGCDSKSPSPLLLRWVTLCAATSLLEHSLGCAVRLLQGRVKPGNKGWQRPFRWPSIFQPPNSFLPCRLVPVAGRWPCNDGWNNRF